MNTASHAFQADRKKFYLIDFGTADPPFRKKLKLWIVSPCFHCVAAYRLGQWAQRIFRRNALLGLPPKIVSALAAFYIRVIYHVDFFAADIGPGLYLSHVGTIYIGPCEIGSNLSITHNTTIGYSIADGLGGVPTLGSNIWIGTGSVIYGIVTLGDGVTVNSGSILAKSIPPQSLVGGNPARILKLNHDNHKLFNGFSC